MRLQGPRREGRVQAQGRREGPGSRDPDKPALAAPPAPVLGREEIQGLGKAVSLVLHEGGGCLVPCL